MKILLVITDLETGGVPLHLLRLATYLQQNGFCVTAVSLAPRGPVSKMLADADVTTLACDAAGPWDWRAVERLAGIIDARRPDCVHSLLFHANLAVRCAGLLAGFDRRRIICEIQTVEIERRWHLPLDRLTQRLCGCVVGNSPSVIEHLATRGGIDRRRLRLIPGGVDVEAVQSAPSISRVDLGIPQEGPLAVWVGRLDPIKGLDVLIRAVERVQDAIPLQLALVGDGPLRVEVEDWVASSRAGEKIHLLGGRGDVASVLKLADLFVFPSRTEGMPNALMEAMAAGLPIVTTDAPGCRDLIQPGRTGLMVPVDDAQALAEAIRRVLSSRTFGDRLGQAAKAYVERNLLLAKSLEAYAELYRITVGRCRAPED